MLEGLGHIEIVRDPLTLELTHWETSPSIVVVSGEQTSELIGHWPRVLLRQMRRGGIAITTHGRDGAPARRTTTASLEELRQVVPGATVVSEPGIGLARVLPALRQVLAALPTTSAPSALVIDRYEPSTDAWVRVASTDTVGSYRTSGYSRTYFVRTATDVESGTARITNVALAKHAAPLLAPHGRPLISYHPNDRELVAPLGAPLPGMYGRAVTLASGQPPMRRDSPAGSYTVYRDVPAEAAAVIYSALGGAS
ncbi:hypothetical protein [Serinibacter arcticus]|uniref:hypothetical protein n=1 Tax=Serinibacter arcticus TaxID=1655435 RepID=UPI001304DD3D|nr:hypothetical protein [Serinibacter arcticus]